MYFFIMVVFGYLSYKCISKLYNFGERKWYGIIFYSAALFGCFHYMRKTRHNFGSLVKEIYLRDNGEDVLFTTFKNGGVVKDE